MLKSLITKRELAASLSLSPRSVDYLVSRKVILVIRLSSRCLRFDFEKVRVALSKYEVAASSRKP